MDEADLTTERMEKEAELRRRLVFVEQLEAVGDCHYCGEPVGKGKKFCDFMCADDWQYEQDRKRYNK